MRRLIEDLFGTYFDGDEPPGGGGTQDPPDGDPPTDDPPGGGGGKTYTEEEMRRVRREAGDYRTKLRDAEGKLKKYEEGDLTEKQRLEKERDDAKAAAEAAGTRLREKAIKAEVAVAAGKLHIVDAETALALIQAKVEFDDQGEPKNVEALLKQLVKDKPFLLRRPGAGSADGGAGGEAPTEGDMNTLLRRAAGRGG